MKGTPILNTQPGPVTAPLPDLADPKHRSMILVNHMGKLLLGLFVGILATCVVLAFVIDLEFTLDLNGTVRVDPAGEAEIVLFADQAQSIVLETGDTAQVFLANGTTVEATVVSILPDTTNRMQRHLLIMKPGGTDMATLSNHVGSPVTSRLNGGKRPLVSVAEDLMRF